MLTLSEMTKQISRRLRQCAQKTSRYCTESCYAFISWCRGCLAPPSPRRQRSDERSWRTATWEFLTFAWLRKVCLQRNNKKYTSNFLQKPPSPRDENDLGLPSNIDLPRTGDEAILRLTECAGRDAYAILGLRYDCTDDEIKSYYKRQAVLVHPDKVRKCFLWKFFKRSHRLCRTSHRAQRRRSRFLVLPLLLWRRPRRVRSTMLRIYIGKMNEKALQTPYVHDFQSR